jgi:hypothetical protein
VSPPGAGDLAADWHSDSVGISQLTTSRPTVVTVDDSVLVDKPDVVAGDDCARECLGNARWDMFDQHSTPPFTEQP